MTPLIIIVFILIALADFPSLIRHKKWYEFTVLSVFFLSAFVLAVLQSLGIPIPSPMKGVAYIIHNVLHLSYS
jgi:phage-related holin